MRLKKRLLALALVVLFVLPGALLSPALQVAASGDLYGTGSADEINIIKLLDMALNKGGMSMSPATIRSFLEYWWSSVQADLSTCISNADSAITTTQAFADYVISALEDADHYDKLGPIIIKYVRYVCAMEGKSLSDIKQLLLQPDTFRRFLLSYVVDEDGNIAGTVDNKLKKYQLKDALVDMTRQAAEAYIEEYEGYYLVPTYTYKDMLPTYFSTKDRYNIAVDFLKKIDDSGLYIYYVDSTEIVSLSGYNFVYTSYGNIDYYGFFEVLAYDDNWKSCKDFDSWVLTEEYLSCFPESTLNNNYYRFNLRVSFYADISVLNSFKSRLLFTNDGRSIKVWKSLDAFKQYSAGKSNVYYTNDYSAYDSSVDNSVEFTGSYYSSNSYSHDVIQNNIDNSSEINESTINNIVNNYITNNNYGDSSGSSGSGGGSGSSGNGWWNIGDGIDALIEGVAALLDFLLKLIGDLIGLLSSFLTGLLEAMGKIAELGQGFSNFLTAAFGFIPEECISLIVASVGVMCAVGVFKIFKK